MAASWQRRAERGGVAAGGYFKTWGQQPVALGGWIGVGSLQAQWFCLHQPRWPSSLKPTVTGGLLLLNRAAGGFSCLLPPFWAEGGLTLDFGVVPPFSPALFFQMLLGDRRAVLVSGPPKPCPCPSAHPVPQHLAVTLLCATVPSGHPTPLIPRPAAG